jgi:uncharacterized protein
MKTVLILHGITGYAGIHWQQWLHDKLIEHGYRVMMPTLPEPNHPERNECLVFIKNLLKNIDTSNLIIVGHSLGVATALDYLKTLDTPIKALVSVSGFYEDYGAELNSYFMSKKEIDINKVKQVVDKVFVLYGNDDPYVPQETLRSLALTLDVKPIIFKNGGHLNARAGYTEFPELLNIIKNLE